MDKYYERLMLAEREPAVATHHPSAHREAKWFAAHNAFDLSEDRATAALRRWVDGMEAALRNRKS